jgi:hypothetical protein
MSKKSWWNKDKVVIAGIAAVGGVAVALVNLGAPARNAAPAAAQPALPTITQTQTVNIGYPIPSPGPSASEEYIQLLENRAEVIRQAWTGTGDHRLPRFELLHGRNIQALRDNQQIVSHELNNEIQALLREDPPGADMRRYMPDSRSEHSRSALERMLLRYADEKASPPAR